MTKKSKSPFKDETLADIVQYCGSQEELMATFKQLQKAMIEKALEGELGYHLGYHKGERSDSTNSRNGYGSKSIITDNGELDIATPRDRDSSFEPQLIKKDRESSRDLMRRLSRCMLEE